MTGKDPPGFSLCGNVVPVVVAPGILRAQAFDEPFDSHDVSEGVLDRFLGIAKRQARPPLSSLLSYSLTLPEFRQLAASARRPRRPHLGQLQRPPRFPFVVADAEQHPADADAARARQGIRELEYRIVFLHAAPGKVEQLRFVHGHSLAQPPGKATPATIAGVCNATPNPPATSWPTR